MEEIYLLAKGAIFSSHTHIRTTDSKKTEWSTLITKRSSTACCF